MQEHFYSGHMIWHLINAYFKYHAPWLLETLFFKASLRTDCKALHMHLTAVARVLHTHTHTKRTANMCTVNFVFLH